MTDPGRVEWRLAGDAAELRLAGDLRGFREADWPDVPTTAGAESGLARLHVEASSLRGWDAALAARLWAVEREWRGAGAEVEHRDVPEGLSALLTLAESRAEEPAATPQRAPAGGGVAREASRTLAFIGEVLIAAAGVLKGRGSVRGADVLEQLDHCGPRSLPIVVLCCALVGLMLTYMGGAQLGRIGAQGFLADVVTVGMLRELSGLMVGIMLAGRIGAAFAAQLAAMKAGEEIDALQVLGVDPVAHLVLPRLLALLAMGPALYACGALAGIVAGWPAASLAYGVSTAEYWAQVLRAVQAVDLWIGLFKCMLYVTLVALAGCREGLAAARSASAVGAASTAAVVKALVWIVAAACTTTVVFTALGY